MFGVVDRLVIGAGSFSQLVESLTLCVTPFLSNESPDAYEPIKTPAWVGSIVVIPVPLRICDVSSKLSEA
ncbi:MAG: hypothetical protein Cons2KO_07230 [Congregibacter sp.]